MWRGLPEYIAYELVLTYPAVSYMSGSFNFYSFAMGGSWLYSSCFMEYFPQDLYYIARRSMWKK